jgi:hypothetical protein
MVFRAIPSPVIVLKTPGSSSRELGSPPEFVVPTSARASEPCLRTTHDHERLPWGSSTSSRHQLRESTCDGHPRPTSFRPQRFTRSRRLTPRVALQTCFILLPRPGFALQGFAPSYQPYHLVGGRSLRAVGAARLSPVARLRQQTSRRPRGLHPVRDPLHRRRV